MSEVALFRGKVEVQGVHVRIRVYAEYAHALQSLDKREVRGIVFVGDVDDIPCPILRWFLKAKLGQKIKEFEQ